MATNTPTFDLDREDPGADGWTDRINGNFTDIETLLTGGTVNGENPSISPDAFNGETHVVEGSTETELQTTIDNATAGDKIVVHGDITQTDSIDISKRLFLDGSNATLTLADGAVTDGDTLPGQLNITSSSNGVIYGFEIDGNYQNQTFTTHPSTPFAQGIYLQGGEDNGTGAIEATETIRWRVINNYVHDTVRSCYTDEGQANIALGNHFADSAADHLIYLARAREAVTSVNQLQGSYRGEAIAIGTDGFASYNNLVTNTTLADIVDTPDAGESPPQFPVNFREVTGCRNNRVASLTVNAEGAPTGQTVLCKQEASGLVDYDYFGPLDDTRKNAVLFSGVASLEGAHLSGNVRITDTSNATAPIYGVEISSPGVTVNLTVTDETDFAQARGAFVTGADRVVDDVSLKGEFRVTGDPIRAAGDTNAVTFSRLDYAGGDGNINTSGTVNLQYVDTATGNIASSSI